MAKENVREIDGITAEEASFLESLQDAQEKLTVDESPEEKVLRKTLELTDDAMIQEAIRSKLDSLDSEKTTSDAECMELVKSIGIPLATVLKNGYSKIENSRKWAIKQRAAKAKESTKKSKKENTDK